MTAASIGNCEWHGAVPRLADEMQGVERKTTVKVT
jgi:hypothetical protein